MAKALKTRINVRAGICKHDQQILRFFTSFKADPSAKTYVQVLSKSNIEPEYELFREFSAFFWPAKAIQSGQLHS